ncbi:hypothetical protein [Rhizobium sp. 1399]|uniref:hypothetical protein n=1 Tax=Rhizobium sp. 1399 TaxID=2817758 RepID=UPI0028625E02|nr:hypothetical protein [Rhizobium sp. 1399]MDR6671398.1 hypothetical protein [Rhizobium sp. 1399]
MRKKIDEITRPAPSATGRHATANENRPARSPSAGEMIAEAETARATLDTDGDEPATAEKPGEGQADNKALAGGPLPTMEELELARDDHSRKIAGREADGED